MSAEVGPVYVDVSAVRTIAVDRGDLEEWCPQDVTHNPVSGHILVADRVGDCIRVFSDNPPYTYITRYGREGHGEGEYSSPYGITCDSEGRLIVADERNSRLQVLSSTGQYLGQVKGFGTPWFLGLDGEDNMYVTGGGQIHVYNPQGEPLPIIMRREWFMGVGGEHLYQVGRSDNRHHIHIHSLTDRSDVKTVPLPQQITAFSCSDTPITAFRDGRLLITAQGWRAGVGADTIDYNHTYMYVLDGAGHNLTPRPYRYEGCAKATTLLYDNTLVVVDRKHAKLVLVTLPSLNPPLRPLHPARAASLKNLCIYKIRSMVNTADDIHTLAPDIGAHLVSRLYI